MLCPDGLIRVFVHEFARHDDRNHLHGRVFDASRETGFLEEGSRACSLLAGERFVGHDGQVIFFDEGVLHQHFLHCPSDVVVQSIVHFSETDDKAALSSVVSVFNF